MQSTTEYTTKGSTIQSTAYHGSNTSTTYYCRTIETAQSAASSEVSISITTAYNRATTCAYNRAETCAYTKANPGDSDEPTFLGTQCSAYFGGF